MLGITPPVPLVSPILDAIFHTIQNSPVSIPAGKQRRNCRKQYRDENMDSIDLLEVILLESPKSLERSHPSYSLPSPLVSVDKYCY